MWREISDEYVESIEKCVGNYDIFMDSFFPYSKVKMKIYKKQNGDMYGKLNVKIKDNDIYKNIISTGATKKEVFDNMYEIIRTLYDKHPDGFNKSDIKYLKYIEF